MDRLVDRVLDGLDAAVFLQIWQHFDLHDNGFIQRKALNDFFRLTLHKLGLKREEVTEQTVQLLSDRVLSAFDPDQDSPLPIQEVAALLLPEDEKFLLQFRREAPLDNSVDFMRIWRSYDLDGSGFICSAELRAFLRDLFQQQGNPISAAKLDLYTVSMMQMFDKNRDGRLDLSDLARILAVKENFLLKFQKDGCSVDERRRDFEKIFCHYDVSGTGALEGPEVDGFVKDMMELVKPNLSGTELDLFRKLLLNHCDLNNDGKIQKNELALCLGIKL